MERFFKLKERGTTVKTEFIAGMTTFFSMVYILMVNANMFADPFGDGSNPLGVSYGAIYIATAVSAVVGTVLAGLLANLPLAQASGMGLNAFFVYTVCIGFGLSYANALVPYRGYYLYSANRNGAEKKDIRFPSRCSESSNTFGYRSIYSTSGASECGNSCAR